MFSLVWNFIKLFLEEKTIEKIQIHSKDTLKILQRYIPNENIPHFWGGACSAKMSDNPGPWKHIFDS